MPRRTKQRPLYATADPAQVRAVAYYRVSSQEQADSGLGLDAQAARVAGMAQAKGWTLTDTYSDEGLSGGKPPSKRPGLARLVADIREGKVDAVIVMKLDRLARDAEFQLSFERELGERGVALLSCAEVFDTTTATGRLFFTLWRDLLSMSAILAVNVQKPRLGVLGKSRQKGKE